MAPGRVNMADLQWPQLLKRLREKRCTPVIGAGASYPFLPLARDLAGELIESDQRDSTRVCPLPDQTDLAKVCPVLAVVNEDAISPKIEIAKHVQARQKTRLHMTPVIRMACLRIFSFRFTSRPTTTISCALPFVPEADWLARISPDGHGNYSKDSHLCSIPVLSRQKSSP